MGKIGEGKRFVHLPAIVFVGLFRCTNSIRKLLLAYKSLIIEHYEEIWQKFWQIFWNCSRNTIGRLSLPLKCSSSNNYWFWYFAEKHFETFPCQNFNSLMIVGQHYSFVIPTQWQNIVFLIFETSSFSYLISEYKVLKIFHICLKIPFCLGLSL